ncbi:MAG: hypothetical protein V4577_09475 [Bacteroidota bacterium]
MITSCEKDNTEPRGFISYKVDGAVKNLSTNAYYNTDNSILIYGTGSNGEKIALYIFMHGKTGEFQFARDIDSALATYSPGYFISDSGKLSVDSFDGRHISGTFMFASSSGKTKKNITDGQFSSTIVNPNGGNISPRPGIDTSINAGSLDKIKAPK